MSVNHRKIKPQVRELALVTIFYAYSYVDPEKMVVLVHICAYEVGLA